MEGLKKANGRVHACLILHLIGGKLKKGKIKKLGTFFNITHIIRFLIVLTVFTIDINKLLGPKNL